MSDLNLPGEDGLVGEDEHLEQHDDGEGDLDLGAAIAPPD